MIPNPKNFAFDEERPKPRLQLVVGTRPDIEERILSDVFVPSHRSWSSLAGSLVLHALVILLVPWVIEFTEWLDINPNQLRLHVSSVQPLRIWVPERLYYTGSTPPSRVSPAPPKLPTTESRDPLPRHDRPRALPTPRKFELPVAPVKAKAEPLILQPPRQNAELTAQVRLPQVMFWARQAPRLQPPNPKAFVMPGRAEAPTPPPMLNAPPKLQVPNQEPQVGDLNVAGVPHRMARGPLVLPVPSATVPVRVIEPPSALRSGSIESAAGVPTNLMVLSANPLPPDRTMIVPPGNKIGALPPPPPAAVTSGTPLPAPSTEMGKPKEDTLLLEARALLPASIPLRMIRPANGVFDLVIVQSSLTDSFPQTNGMLSGKPVYSVYLKIGVGKDWILQYCEPHAQVNFQRSKDIVNLAGASTIKAPYPRLIIAPDIEALATSSYTIIHGMLSATGQLRDLTLKTGPSDAPIGVILPILERWDFRPATKDNQPVEVEVLFAIPPSAQ